MITVYMISAELDHYTSMINLLAHAGHLQEAVNHMWLQAQLSLVLAEFMVIWRLENVLHNGFLKWSLKMQKVMCYYLSLL